MTAEAPILQRGADLHLRADRRQCGADDGAGADLGASGCDERRRMDRCAGSGSIASTSVALRPRPGRRRSATPRHAPARRARRSSVTSSRSRSPGTTWLAELRAVDAAQRRAVRRVVPSAACSEQHARRLGQRLDHQHARHQRRARKVSLEEVFVDGDVLDRDQPLTRT